MKRSAGFTLIELIIVIVILGILAVTAAPKFINMQSDARAASLKAMGGSITSATTMVYSKSILANVDKLPSSNTSATVTINGSAVPLNYGYPTATTTNLTTLLDSFNTTDWSVDTATSGQITIKPSGFTANTCQIVYKEATSTIPASTTVTASTTGC